MKRLNVLVSILLVCVTAFFVQAGTQDRFSKIELTTKDYAEFPQITAPTGNPVNNKGWLYVKDNSGTTNLYYEDDAGTVTNLISPTVTTAWDDIGNPDDDQTITWADNYTTILSFADTDEDMMTIRGVGNFADVSVVKIESITGNPTNGTVLEVVSHDTNADALLVTANSATSLQVYGSGNVDVVGKTGVLNYTFFDVDTNGLMTLATDAGASSIVITPGAAMNGIDASNATITNAISIGANTIAGTTGVIDFTNFDVASDGDVTCVDLTASGNVSITGTFQQDAITAATAATTLTVDGTGVGGVTIGGTSTGIIALGGGATLVNLPSGTDLVLAGGDLTATDTANADMVTFTNNTMTTNDLLTLSATGTRTSNNVISIADGATTASTIAVTANTQTSGYGFSYANSGAGLTGAAINLSVTDGAGFTGDYIRCYDGAAEDFLISRYGATTIAGNASTDVLTVTTGDVQIDDGKIEIDTNEDDTSHIIRNQGATTGPVVEIEETAAAADNAALLIDQNATAAASYGIEIDTEGGDAIHFSDLAATGDGITITTAAAYTGQILAVNDTLVGTNGEGIIDIHTTGNQATDSTLLRLDADTGTLAGATDGFLINVDDDSGAAATSYAVLIDSANNEALHVATGKALFDEHATFTSGIDADGDLDIDFSANTEEMNITFDVADYAAGSGAITVYDTTAAGPTNASYLLRLAREANGDAQGHFILCEDNSTGADGNGDDMFKVDAGGAVTAAGDVTAGGNVNLSADSELTISAGGEITITKSYHSVDTNADGATDDLDTISGGAEGDILVIKANNSGRSVVVKHATGNIQCGADVTLDNANDTCTLFYDGANWLKLSSADNGA